MGEEMFEGIEAVIVELREEYAKRSFKGKEFQYYKLGAIEALNNLLKLLNGEGEENETL